MRFILLLTAAGISAHAAHSEGSIVDFDECKELGVPELECLDMAAKTIANSFGPLMIDACAIIARDEDRLLCYDDFSMVPDNPLWRAMDLGLIDPR